MFSSGLSLRKLSRLNGLEGRPMLNALTSEKFKWRVSETRFIAFKSFAGALFCAAATGVLAVGYLQLQQRPKSFLIDEEFMTMGISLEVLRNLDVSPFKKFADVQEEIKRITKNTKGNRSLASHLYQNPETRGLVGKADYFVSHAWEVSFGETMTALENHFKGKPTPFLWISVAMVDQYASGVNFETWTGMFKRSLNEIGKALLLLSPAEKPVAATRSWCCYEWMCIAQENRDQKKISVEYCVNPHDAEVLIKKMKTGMGVDDFKDIFAEINVEKAKAFKELEERAILELMREVGVKEVNDIVMLNVKEWLLSVAGEGEKLAKPETNEGTSLLNAKASLHEALGELDAALPLYRQALESARKVPSDQSLIARQFNNLALLLEAKGDYDGAEQLIREAINIGEKCLGRDHPDMVIWLNSLASVLRSKGDYVGAEPLYRESLAIRKKVLRHAHSAVAESLNNLAVSLEEGKGDYVESETLKREAVAIFKMLYGDHPSVATLLNNLAKLLKSKGDYDGAEPLYRESLAIRRKTLGNAHPDVAGSLNNLAALLKAKGDYDGAESLYREAVAIWKKAGGDDHPQVATGLNNLAGLLQAKGDYDGAEPLYREAVAIGEKSLEKSHPDLATWLNNLAGLLEAKGDYDGAEPLYRESLDIRKKALVNGHPAVATSLNSLAGLLRVKGEFDVAIKLQKEALAIQEKTQGKEHPQYATGLANLAVLLETKGDYAGAESLNREALRIHIKTLSIDHPDVALDLNNLAELLLQQGKKTEANQLGKEALRIWKQTLGLEHPTTIRAQANWGKDDA